MYYRVAIQLDPSHTWQWRSTVLSSLDALFQLLRRYQALAQDRLRVFSSSSREEINEQLVRENTGLGSTSLTAAQFLQERLICSPEVAWAPSARQGGAHQERAPIAVITHPSWNESSKGVTSADGKGLGALERRRFELERGAGGDHDLPYRFTLPTATPQVLAWVKLLARVQNGDVEP